MEFYTYDLSSLIDGAVKVVIILAAAAAFLYLLKRTIPRAIEARIPRIREESPDELALRSKTLSRTLVQALTFAVWIVAFLMVLGTVGVNITPILASVGVGALALGFAAQNIIRDYLHGFFIIMEDWYRIGEVARVAGIAGLVADLSLRRTVLRDLDGTMHVIPNSNITLASNLTRDWSRINLDVSVAYSTNLDHVIGVINRVCQEMKDDLVWGPDLLTTPKVERVDDLGDSGIAIKILGDTKPIRQWALTGELRKRLKERFDQENIEIPWPHTKVYFGNSPSNN
ncbi:MAG: mechanosensitive ion channel family protein [Chloroflexi bacterium]|nr:mechanosensitive ion channel family protein [Chloroflexota bacterium]MDA1219550.1 mechanosensitive ion channel family protein [Chloroflexota bacterium]